MELLYEDIRANREIWKYKKMKWKCRVLHPYQIVLAHLKAILHNYIYLNKVKWKT